MPSHPIKNWPKDERPREKLLSQGERTLSNTELVAILIGTGTRGESAMDLARKIMLKFGSFQEMGQTDARDWKGFKGLGPSKTAQIKAALEMARRYTTQVAATEKTRLGTTEEIVAMFQAGMRHLKKETFKAVYMDAQNRVLEVVELSDGTPTECHPFLREILSRGLQCFASAFVCLHNHPRGKADPSPEDRQFTREIRDAAGLMGFTFHDHVIFGEDGYYSFDRGIKAPYGEPCLTKT